MKYRITIPAVICDRNFTRTPTLVTIGNAIYPYTINGTMLYITSTNLAITEYLLSLGLEVQIAALPTDQATSTQSNLLPPSLRANITPDDLQALYDNIYDYQCTVDSMQGEINGYKETLQAIKLLVP